MLNSIGQLHFKRLSRLIKDRKEKILEAIIIKYGLTLLNNPYWNYWGDFASDNRINELTNQREALLFNKDFVRQKYHKALDKFEKICYNTGRKD